MIFLICDEYMGCQSLSQIISIDDVVMIREASTKYYSRLHKK